MPRTQCLGGSMNDLQLHRAMKLTLPTLSVTESCQPSDSGAILIADALEPYFVRQVMAEGSAGRRDGRPNWVPAHFNLFPVVLEGSGQPWAEACLYLMSGVEGAPNPDMRTYDARALDLAAYRRFLEETNIDWTEFPKNKLFKPTYRYRAHLNHLLRAGELGAKTLNRRMGSVVGFYRWLVSEKFLSPANPPWKERDVYITSGDSFGFQRTKTVKSTDLAVPVPVQQDTFDETIQDGGRLRPLPMEEQEWLLSALRAAGNIEMTLIHLMALVTGARLQTVCTLKIFHTEMTAPSDPNELVKLPVGPGTGVDTKGDKRMVLHIPGWFYQALQTYAGSERARRRRQKRGKDEATQYLFLSQQGTPYYTDKQERQTFDPTNKRRYDFDGGAIGTFIRNVIRPYVEKTYGCKNFDFSYHDTRATFGMNLTDLLLNQVEAGLLSLSEVREYVKTRMGHASAATTDLYLNFRHRLKFKRVVVEQRETHLKDLCRQAMEGVL